MTPSGFSIGTILKTKVDLRNSAFASSLTRKSITPFMSQLALLSPGCTREVKIMDFRTAMSTGSDKKFVTINISTSFPASDLQSTVFRILSLLLKVQTLFMNWHWSL